MNRELSLYSSAFLVSAALALWAATPSKEKVANQSPIVSIDPSKIGSIEFKDEASSVTINPISKDGKRRWWVTTEKAGVSDRFLASIRIDDTLAYLNPLYAVRVIGVVKDEKLSEFGLNDTKRALEVKDEKGQSLLTLTFGKQAYGSKNAFAKEGKEQRVILIAGGLADDLEAPESKLFERTMSNVPVAELETAVIRQSDKSKKLFRSNKGEKGATVWSADSVEGSLVPSAQSWFERLDRLRVMSYVAESEFAALESAPVLFQVELISKDARDELKFVKVSPSQAASSNVPAAAGDYFVYSGFLGTWAKLVPGRMDPIEKDLNTVLAP